MKTLILSDLHYDYNSYKLDSDIIYGFENEINNTDLVLIAGDIGGSSEVEQKILDRLQSKITGNTKVCVVCGNHLGYDKFSTTSAFKNIKENQLLDLRTKYAKDNIFYLENDFVDLGRYAVIGCCLYTDFSLHGIKYSSKRDAGMMMNDFRYVLTMDCNNGVIRNVIPDDYEKWFNNSVEYIKKMCKRFENKKIILLTHFLVTPQSISPKYITNELNPFYCTNLEQLLLDNPNIVLVASGHSHEPSDIQVGDTRVILEPYGYYGREQQLLPQGYYGKVVEI